MARRFACNVLKYGSKKLSCLTGRSARMYPAAAYGLLCSAAVFSSNNNNNNFKGITSLIRNYSSDPTARRPTAKCDPYEQGGKPLDETEVQRLLSTLDPNSWTVIYNENDGDDQGCCGGNNNKKPIAIERTWEHPDYFAGGKFISRIAALAQVHNHFPVLLKLDRKLGQRQWHQVSCVRCSTRVLKGLSYQDFHLATMIDIECVDMAHLLLLDTPPLQTE